MKQTDAAEVEADRLDYDLFYESGLGLDGPTVERIVTWLLTSDWLAAREAAAEARALREAADECRVLSDEADVRASRGDRYADVRRLTYERIERRLRARAAARGAEGGAGA